MFKEWASNKKRNKIFFWFGRFESQPLLTYTPSIGSEINTCDYLPIRLDRKESENSNKAIETRVSQPPIITTSLHGVAIAVVSFHRSPTR